MGVQGCVLHGTTDASLQKLTGTLRDLAAREHIASRPCTAVEARSYMATLASSMASLAHLGDSFFTAVGDWTSPPKNEKAPTLYVRSKLSRSAWSKVWSCTVSTGHGRAAGEFTRILNAWNLWGMKICHIDAARTEASAMWQTPESCMTPTTYGVEFVKRLRNQETSFLRREFKLHATVPTQVDDNNRLQAKLIVPFGSSVAHVRANGKIACGEKYTSYYVVGCMRALAASGAQIPCTRCLGMEPDAFEALR